MSTIKGYGISIRNTPIDITQTVSYQELNSIGFYGDDAVIDIVRSDAANRPELERLIAELQSGDRIDMYSVDSLLLGCSKKAKEYYASIIEKGIDLLIYDFTGAIAKLSPLSTIRFGDPKKGEPVLMKSEKSIGELVNMFSDYAKQITPRKKSGGLKAEKRLDISEAFKEIYFAYESYQIDQPTTLSLLKEFCGIENKITFWLMARDYENTLRYADELSEQRNNICELPKRCGGLPAEYEQILVCADTRFSDIKSEKDRIESAMLALNMIGSYTIFKRWQLLAAKKPKPRKPIPYDFNITEFRKKYGK